MVWPKAVSIWWRWDSAKASDSGNLNSSHNTGLPPTRETVIRSKFSDLQSSAPGLQVPQVLGWRLTWKWEGKVRDSQALLSGGKYQIFSVWNKVSNSWGFLQSSHPIWVAITGEERLASLSSRGDQDLGFRLPFLRIGFLFSTKGYLPHFVLSIIDTNISWLSPFQNERGGEKSPHS